MGGDHPQVFRGAVPLDWNRFIAVPYRKFGRSLAGCDCYGLVRLVLADAGIALPLHPHMSDARLTQCLEAAAVAWIEIDRAGVRPLDVARIRTLAPGFVAADTHLGIVAPRDLLLHAESSYGCSHFTPLDHPALARRILGFYRHPDLA